MAIIIPLVKGATLTSIVRDGVKAAFGFTAKRVLWLGFIMLAFQVFIAIGWILFVSPENMLSLLNGLLERLGLTQIDCSTLPAEVCPLLNIAGLNEMYNSACYYAVALLLVWLAIKRLVMIGRSWFILRGFGS